MPIAKGKIAVQELDRLSPLGALLGDEDDSSRAERAKLLPDEYKRERLPRPPVGRMDKDDQEALVDDELAGSAPFEDESTGRDILPDKVERNPR